MATEMIRPSHFASCRKHASQVSLDGSNRKLPGLHLWHRKPTRFGPHWLKELPDWERFENECTNEFSSVASCKLSLTSRHRPGLHLWNVYRARCVPSLCLSSIRRPYHPLLATGANSWPFCLMVHNAAFSPSSEHALQSTCLFECVK